MNQRQRNLHHQIQNIRNKIFLGENVTSYLDSDVIEYIKNEQLYKGDNYAKNK